MEVVGTAKTGTKGTTETGTVGIAETGAMGVARVVAEGMSTSVMTPGPSKISTKHGDIKGNCSKGETQIHAPKEEMTKKGGGMDLAKNKKKGERYMPMNSVRGEHPSYRQSQKSSSSKQVHCPDPQGCP